MSAADDLIAGRYRLVRLVGRGGMGAVWEGRDERLHRPVALKLLHRQLGHSTAEADLANQRALREARITARLHHRHAVPVFDVVEHEGRPCLVMPFVPSTPLSTVLRDRGPLEAAEAAKIGAQISSALAAAHGAGIVHRDVKPGNILIAEDGNALISDFGISHAFGDATLTATGLVHGTPAFLAPEVARGTDSSFASDVFSFGSTLYTAVEGAPPFGTEQNMMALLHRVASGEFERPVRSGPMTDLLMEMLSTDPQDRPTMQEVASTLGGLAAGRVPPVAGLSPTPTLQFPPAGARPGGGPGSAGSAGDEATPKRPVRPPVAPVPAAVARPQPPAQAARPPAPVQPAPARSDRKGNGATIGVAAALVIVLVAAAVWWLTQRPGSLVGAGASASPSATAATDPTSAAPSESPSTSPSPSASASPTPSATSASPTPTPSDGEPAAAELAAAVTDYYALMPDQTDQAWPRLTASYQANPAGGKKSYEQFWKQVEKVAVSGAVGKPPNQAEATITYTYKNGRVVKERTAYGLVNEDGIWKINTTRSLG